MNNPKGTTLLSINDVTTIVNDARANVIGGIKLAIDIWELAIIPFLLNNGGTWTGIDSKGMEILDDLQKTFMKRLLKVKTASIPLMLWDLKQYQMKNRIMKMKLMLLKHLSSLDDSSLAKKVYIEVRSAQIKKLTKTDPHFF